MLSELLNCSRVDVHVRSQFGRTILHSVVLRDGLKCVRRILKCDRFDVNCQDEDEATAAHCAARNVNNIGTHIVIDSRIVREQLERGSTYVSRHSKLVHPAIFCAFVESDRVDLDVFDRFGFTPVHYAARFGRFDYLKLILLHRNMADLQVRTRDTNQTFLHIAADYGRSQVICMLKDVPEIDRNVVDVDERGVLHLASANGRADIIQYLLSDENIDLNIVNKWVSFFAEKGEFLWKEANGSI
jgi:ankyrin repeat protein